MSEELKFEFNDYVIAIDEPYENDCGYVSIGKKQSNGINIVFKSPNKGTVNWFIELQKYITDLQSQLDQANERLKEIDNFKYNYGYTNYEDSYMLEDLQSRAFQGEDDTAVVESLFDFFDICDENEILPKVEEISEKLKCAIVPKFKIGQEVWWIDTRGNIYNKQNYKIDSYLIDSIVVTDNKFRYYGEDGCWLGEEDLFATEQEAQAKLQELRGGE